MELGVKPGDTTQNPVTNYARPGQDATSDAVLGRV
jgi:hypothetical protein